MSHDGVTNTKQMMVVISTVEEWSSLQSLLQDSSGVQHLQITFSSVGPTQVCDLTTPGSSVSLRYPDLKQDMTEEAIGQALDGCFYKACVEGVSSFLLLIQGGHYTKRERRMVDILQANFGAEALKYLAVLSLEDGKVAETLDDALLDLINVCDGRYSRITSSTATDKLHALFEMVDHMLSENGATGYTETMLSEARKNSTEDSAMKMLKQKVQDAGEKEQDFKELAKQREERRAREMEELKRKHAEERKMEAAEKKQFETKRESLEEAVMSHRAMLQLQVKANDGDDTKKISVMLLGLSGSGKSSALNLILERAGNQYSTTPSTNEPPQPTLYCQKSEVFAAGHQLILVDTPELWDEDGAEDLDQVKDCLALSLPGPHVFLLVLQVGRFTQGECEMLGELQKIFGRDFTEHAMVLFVRFFDGSQHRPQRINEYVAGAHTTLRDLVRKCGSRYYELSVTSSTKSQNALSYPQVKELLGGISKLVASHGGCPHTVKRFSEQELRQRKKDIEERKEGAMEGNYLLRDGY